MVKLGLVAARRPALPILNPERRSMTEVENTESQLASTGDVGTTSAMKPAIRNAFTACFRIFYSPRAVSEEIAAGLPWWPGFLVALVLIFLALFFLAPLLAEAFYMMIEAGTLPVPQEEIASLSSAEFKAKARIPIAVLLTVLSQLTILFGIFFYWLAVLITFGAGSFGRIFTARVYTSFIDALALWAGLIFFSVAQPEFTDLQSLMSAGLDLSPAAFMEGDGYLIRLMRQLSLFSFWRFGLFVAVVATVVRRPGRQVTWPLGVIFILGILIQAMSN